MRKLIIGLVCLVGIAVVVDFGAAAYSEYRVSRALREGGSLTADPEVTVHGFPFLTQAWRGKYDDVEIRARQVHRDMIGDVTIEATLNGVSVPASSILDGSVSQVPVDHLEGRMMIDATDLGKFLGIPDLQVSAPPADKSDGTGGSGGSGSPTTGGIVFTGTVPVGPLQTSVSVQADLVLRGEQLMIVATDFYFGPEGEADFSVPNPLRQGVLDLFTKTIDPQALPFGIMPTDVYAEGSQIVVEGTGDHLVIDLDRLQEAA
ncbi:LmeA family phospholipid-binding protein [Prescottella subtropica]|uniref:LmeA family phospholipid-binding protein n=1 Tax=Prescottella subtropica TaxID=2545757 RepID=UPI0010F65B6E|nr:LmeA family phospholipid-binding protein [Prescottella subtropica]